MKAPETITLNGTIYDLEWIRRDFRQLKAVDFTPHELKILRFCGEWLSGADYFAVQTSGSTGTPKTIRLSRQKMVKSAGLTATALGLTQGQRALVCLSPSHIAGKMMLVRGMELGLELDIIEPAANPFFAFKGADPHFDFTALVPLQLSSLLSGDVGCFAFLGRMQSVLVGGSTLPDVLCRKVKQLRCKVWQSFGMTETATHIALRRLNGPHPQDTYETLPGVKIGQDAEGCLTILSDLTGGRLLLTNDIVEIVNDHAFQWLGRRDWVINSGGVKVHPERVEAAIQNTLAELDAAWADLPCLVAPQPDARLGQKVVAIFELPGLVPPFWPELSGILPRKLHPYEIPRDVYCVPSLARTPTGKLDRKSATERFLLESGQD